MKHDPRTAGYLNKERTLLDIKMKEACPAEMFAEEFHRCVNKTSFAKPDPMRCKIWLEELERCSKQREQIAKEWRMEHLHARATSDD